MAFNAPAPVLPLYTRGSPAPTISRRVAVLLAQVLAAAAYGFAAVALPPTMLTLLAAPVGACLLLALWLMPDRGIFPLRVIERIYLVLLILMVVWPTYLAVVLPGLPWLTPTRMALFLLTFFFLYSVSTSGALRRHLWTVARSSPGIWIAFLIWQASMFYTIPFSRAIPGTLKFLLDNQLRLTEMFFVGCLVFARRRTPTRALGWLVVLAVISGIDGFIELHLEMPPWANHIPGFLKVDDATMANALGSQARSADGLYRVRGPFPNSLIFAEFLALCTPFMIHWTITGRSLLLRVMMAAAFVFTVAVILITQSRLGLVGALLGVGAYVPLWAFRQWRAKPTSLMGPALLFGAPLLALLLVGVVFSSHTLTMRVLGGGAQAASNEARAQQRRMAIPKIAANPIGHGIGQSGQVLGFVNQAGQMSVDNHYISTLIDLGVVGALGFYGMFLIGAWTGARLYLTTDDRETELAGPLAVSFLIFFVVKSVLSQENNHPLILLLLGMMAALLARERKLIDPDNLFPRGTGLG